MKLILFQLILWFCTIAYAEQPNDKTLALFKSYLRDIKSIAVDFHQTDSQSVRADGKLLISKPYKFRCNYYPPFPLVIIGNKNYVSVYDYDMENLSRIKSEENIFNFLLTNEIDFEKHFEFKSATEDASILSVTLYHVDSDRESTITVSKDTNQIKMLEIVEGDNVITIKFEKVYRVRRFDEGLFIIKNPSIFGIPTKFTKEEIEKKYDLAS